MKHFSQKEGTIMTEKLRDMTAREGCEVIYDMGSGLVIAKVPLPVCACM